MNVFDPTKPAALGADHAGFELKNELIEFMKSKGVSCHDLGTYSKESVDYPDMAHPVAHEVENGEAGFGILICGSANGVAMTANKHAGIRAAICWNEEVAALARQHNNANILCIPARFVDMETAKRMTEIFINTAFEGGRHLNRVNKINC
jgi:ribose 5-phosphate isomerase B